MSFAAALLAVEDQGTRPS